MILFVYLYLFKTFCLFALFCIQKIDEEIDFFYIEEGNYILLYTISKIIKGHMIMYPFIIQSFFSFFFPSLLF